ncbi:uncharacterized protein LOC134267242 [Saccostrea cucullata]|uniref:uncharacterized protein LOC134267242 n=1 Tax=Saccostrea cuccullata TaxID=36930 RepID=UPI002ED50C26
MEILYSANLGNDRDIRVCNVDNRKVIFIRELDYDEDSQSIAINNNQWTTLTLFAGYATEALQAMQEGAKEINYMEHLGGDKYIQFYFKEWEKVVLQTLSDIAIEGIRSGVDTAECITAPSPVTSSDLSHTASQLTLIPSSDISQSATIPCTSNSQQFVDPLTQDVSFMYNADMNAEKECSRSVENRKKQARAPRQESEVPVSKLLLEMEKKEAGKGRGI